MADCVFCMIANHEIPSNIAYEDDQIICFHDLEPQAPVHVLVIPKTHIDSADCLTKETAHLAAEVFAALPKVARACGLVNGYRVITNVGEDGCQSVRHMHFHLLGGKKLPEQMS